MATRRRSYDQTLSLEPENRTIRAPAQDREAMEAAFREANPHLYGQGGGVDRAQVEAGMRDFMGPFYKNVTDPTQPVTTGLRPNLVEDPSAGMPQDPYSDLLSQLMGMAMDPAAMEERRQAISSSYDAQTQALREAGGLATGAIGDYFGYAQGVAEEGRGAVGDVYGSASEQVSGIYDQLGSSLRSIPQDVTDLARQVAGDSSGGPGGTGRQGVGGAVAERAASAVAPFMAAGETARASGLENLTRRSAAAQNYMSQLAAANPAEAAQRQSSVEAGIAQRAAQIEGAKQQALLEYASDAPGDTFNRMLDVLQMQLQFDKLGLAQEELDVRRQGLQGAGGMGGMDLSDVNALLNIQEKQDPYAVGGRRGANMAISGDPEAQAVFGDILSRVEEQFPSQPGAQEMSEQALLKIALDQLSGTYATETEQQGSWLPWVDDKEVPAGGASEVIDPEDYRMVEEALRIMYGG